MIRDVNGPGSPKAGDSRARNTSDASAPAANKIAQGKTAAATPPSVEDVVKISPQAAAIKALEVKINKLPDTNAERVATIKKQLADGKYPFDAKKVAQKLLDLDNQIGE